MTVYKGSVLVAVWVGCLLAATGVHAEEPMSIRAMGMGDALGAAATADNSLFLNPAGMSLANTYALTGWYEYSVRRQGHITHVSVVDSTTSRRVHAGLYYTFHYSRPEVFEPRLNRSIKLKVQGHETGLAISVPIGQYVILGAQASYIFLERTTQVPGDEEGKTTDVSTKVNTTGMTAGMVIRPTQALNIAVVGRNLVPTHTVENPMELVVGAAYSFKRVVLVDVDLLLNFDTPERKQMVGVRAGLEAFIKGKVSIRGGAWYAGYPGATYLTVGLGYISPKVAVDVGFAQQVDGGVETRFGLGLRLFFNQ